MAKKPAQPRSVTMPKQGPVKGGWIFGAPSGDSAAKQASKPKK